MTDVSSSCHAYILGGTHLRVTDYAVNVEYLDSNSQLQVTNYAVMVEYYLWKKDTRHAYLEGTSGTLVRSSVHAYLDHAYLYTSTPAFVWGGLIENRTYWAYTKGQTTGASSKTVYLWGQPGSFKSAYLKGTSVQRLSSIGIQVETHSYEKLRMSAIGLMVETHGADNQRVSAIGLQVESHYGKVTSTHAYLSGIAPFSVNWASVSHPDLVAWYVDDFKPVSIHGAVVRTSYIHAYTINAEIARGSTPAHITSWSGVTPSVQHAYMHGLIEDYRTSAHAYVHSGTRVTGNKSAYLRAMPGSFKQAFTEGMGTPRVTNAGMSLEWRSPATVRITMSGISVETRDAPFVRITNAGIIIEWEVSVSSFGPDAWII